jgi:hypothetical protein
VDEFVEAIQLFVNELLGGTSAPWKARPQMDLADLDRRTFHLQVTSIELSTAKGYAIGARDYISFCKMHSISLAPTPKTLSRYIAYTSQFIASGPKYLSGARHFLKDLYPEWDERRADPLVQATIRGSKKARKQSTQARRSGPRMDWARRCRLQVHKVKEVDRETEK